MSCPNGAWISPGAIRSSPNSQTQMQISSYTVPPSSEHPFFMTAKRYWLPGCEEQEPHSDGDARSLILLHSTSFHKEIWEPFMQAFYRLVSKRCRQNGTGNRTKTGTVRDAWAIECPNHGESAYLNLRLWGSQKPHESLKFSCQKYAEAVHRFLSIDPSDPTGPRFNFRQRKLIGIGHSLGANSLLLLQAVQPVIDFAQLVIIEPMISASGPSHLWPLRDELLTRALQRTDVWPTREAARRTAAKRKWDPSVVDVFVKHGIYWNPDINAFTLCCSREQEIGMYLDAEGPTKPVEVLNKVCHKIPIDIVLGEYFDLVPENVHRALLDPSSGRRFASFKMMEKVGHLIPQQRPTELAHYLFELLSLGASNSVSSSRL